MFLMTQIQQITERTYKPTGVNFENFLINRDRFIHLSQFDTTCQELPDYARVFFRICQKHLYVGIYYAKPLICTLEANDPRAGLSENNIAEFCIFIEEINHAIHGALKYMEGNINLGRDSFTKDLELQAKIDTYLILKFFLACRNKSKQLELLDRLWIRYHLFDRVEVNYISPHLNSRYSDAIELGEKYTRFIDTLPISERLQEIRRFRKFPYKMKTSYIKMLP